MNELKPAVAPPLSQNAGFELVEEAMVRPGEFVPDRESDWCCDGSRIIGGTHGTQPSVAIASRDDPSES